MSNRFFSLLLAGTVLSGATVALADIAITPSLSGSEYTEAYKHNGAYVPSMAEADTIELTVNDTAVASEVGGGHIIHVNSETEGNTNFRVLFSNHGNLSTSASAYGDEDGHIFYMDTRPTRYVDLSGTEVFNSGKMTTEGSGYAVYANPLENQSMTTIVTNNGTMDRINLYQTDASQVTNGGIINGSVLLGPNALLYNHGKMQNKTGDYNKDFINTDFVSNSIWMDRRGEIQNGFAVTVDEKGKEIHVHMLDPTDAITTDNIYFKQTGELYTAGIINNKYIGAGDSIKDAEENPEVKLLRTYVRLLNNPFYETDIQVGSSPLSNHLKYNTSTYAGTTTVNDTVFEFTTDTIMAASCRADVTTDTLATGDKAQVFADMGSHMNIQNLTLGESAEFELGRRYFLPNEAIFNDTTKNAPKLTAEISVDVEHVRTNEEGELEKYTEAEDRKLTEIPHRSEAYIKNATFGKDSTITLSNMADVEGENITLGENNTLSVTGGSLNLSGAIDVKGSTDGHIVYWGESRKKDDPAIYSLRMPSFVNFGEAAGELVLPNGTYYLANTNPPSKSYYGNDYIGYVKAYTKWTESLKTPSSLANFDDYQDSTLSADKDATIKLNTYSRNNMISLSDDETKLVSVSLPEEHIRSVLPINEEEEAILLVKNLSLEKDNALVDMNGGILAAKTIKIGDNGTLKTSGGQNAIFAETVTFGNKGTFETAEDFYKVVGYNSDGDAQTRLVPSTLAVLDGQMTFGDDGLFYNRSLFKATKLVMNDRSRVEVGDGLWAETWLGSNSVVNIHPFVEKGDRNGLSAGLFKKKGAKNVIVNSTALNLNTEADNRRIYNENYLLNGVNVDEINILGGGLLMGTTDPNSAKGDIYGKILMSSDTWVHFMGNNVKVYDPIARAGGATNTLVWFDLDDAAQFDTLNTIDSDDVLISGGVLNVHHTITAPTITLDSSGSLRVYDNLFVKADVVEYEGSGANTTLFIAPRFEKVDSFGRIALDRLVVENGSFNTYHPILARGDNDGRPEGIWLGTDATINVHSDVRASRLVRREDVTGPVTNTTATVDNGSLIVDNSVNIDTLKLTKGTFAYRNAGEKLSDPLQKNAYITNDVFVGKSVNFWANGSDNDESGRMIIGGGNGLLTVDNGHLGLAPDTLKSTDTAGTMNLQAHLAVNNAGILDLRTTDSGSDRIYTTKTATLSDRTRLFVRNLKTGTDYLLLTADGGLTAPDSFATSFLWHDTVIGSPDGHNLWLNVGSITTLKEELENGNVSDNVRKVGGYISDHWDGNFGPWDEIFYATSLGNAVSAIAEYVPEGYINAPQAALRTTSVFHSVMSGELEDMRQLAVNVGKNRVQGNQKYHRSAYYSGRSGGDSQRLYQPYVRSQYRTTSDVSSRSPVFVNGRKKWRTDKGGLWAKPFYVSATQDDDRGISGYEYKAWGLAAGIDKRFGRWSWGLSGVYAKGDYNSDNDVIKADVDTWGVGLYGSYRPNRSPFFTNLFASYSVNGNDAKHRIKAADTTLKSDYDVKSIGAGIAFGYDFALAKSMYLTPKIGFNYTRLATDTIKEKGTAPIVVRVKTPAINSMQLPVEVRLAFPIESYRFGLLPELHVRYTHDFGDTDYKSKVYLDDDTEVKLDSVGMPENVFTLGGSLDFTAGAHEFSGQYDYDFGDGLTSHLFNIGYKYLF